MIVELGLNHLSLFLSLSRLETCVYVCASQKAQGMAPFEFIQLCFVRFFVVVVVSLSA